jgi:hypothetical protein
MKQASQQLEGPEAWAAFDNLVTSVLKVPRAEIERREAEYQRQSKLNPNRRGPKPKASSSRAPRA